MSRTLSGAVTIVSSLAFATACENIDKQKSGVIVGGIVGAIAGAIIGKGSNQVVATAVGAVVGGFLGSEIGRALDEADRKAIARQTEDALNKEQAGTTVYKNEKSDVTSVVTTTPVSYETRTYVVEKPKSVNSVPQIELLNQTYITKNSMNVRAGPSLDERVVDSLPIGRDVVGVGRVIGTKWILAAREGRTIGYVYEPLLELKIDKPNNPIVIAPKEEGNRVVQAKSADSSSMPVSQKSDMAVSSPKSGPREVVPSSAIPASTIASMEVAQPQMAAIPPTIDAVPTTSPVSQNPQVTAPSNLGAPNKPETEAVLTAPSPVILKPMSQGSGASPDESQVVVVKTPCRSIERTITVGAGKAAKTDTQTLRYCRNDQGNYVEMS